jgi:hypothetical protein
MQNVPVHSAHRCTLSSLFGRTFPTHRGRAGDPRPVVRVVRPQSIVRPSPNTPTDAAAADPVAIHEALQALTPQQQQRLADALFMQTTAMHHFQTHSALPEEALERSLTADAAAAAALVKMGMHAEAAEGGNSGTEWTEDYRRCLEIATVRRVVLAQCAGGGG